jgi:hypothetical protein
MAGAVSALFLLDIKGRVLISRDYRGDVSAVQAEKFFTKLIEKEVPSSFLSLSLIIRKFIAFDLQAFSSILICLQYY